MTTPQSVGAAREATGSAQPQQARPVTLFTGQWADLPFEQVCDSPPAGATTASRSPAGATTST